MTELRFEWLHPSAADPNPLNWRRHPERQTQALDTLIFGEGGVGWAGVVLVNERRAEDGWPSDDIPTVIEGHARQKLALLHDEPVPALIGQWTPTQEKTILATLDPLSALAETDDIALERLLKDVQTDDPDVQALLDGLARDNDISFFDGEDTDLGDVPAAQPDRAAELQEKWGTEAGQLWLIPSETLPDKFHRLLCGDSTKDKDVKRLMDKQKADLVSTDPPYLVEYTGNDRPAEDKDWSKHYTEIDIKDADGFLSGFVQLGLKYAKEDAAWYVWHADMRGCLVRGVLEKAGLLVHQTIVWVKPKTTLTYSVYQWGYEPAFFGWLKGNKPYIPQGWFKAQHPNVWHVDWDGKNANTDNDHPTQKPLELFARPIRNHTRKGEICYEPFTGSGSQFIAAEKLGRLCYGLEISPAFVAVTLERLSEMGLAPKLAK